MGEVNERVYHWRHEGNLASRVCRTGKPSHTHMAIMAHCRFHGQDLSSIGIRIRTGRRHQIRTHTKYIGHPTVCDGKYADSMILLAPSAWQDSFAQVTSTTITRAGK